MKKTLIAFIITFGLIIVMWTASTMNDSEYTYYENDDLLCSDNVDNDHDGLYDCDDPDCQPLLVCLNSSD